MPGQVRVSFGWRRRWQDQPFVARSASLSESVTLQSPAKKIKAVAPADTTPSEEGPAMTAGQLKARLDDFVRWRTRHLQLHRPKEGSMPE